MKKTSLLVIVLFALCAGLGFAQDIITVEKYFDTVSEAFTGIQDYQAKITITKNKEVMSGILSFRAPNFMRIDFTQPAGQAIVLNETELLVFIPDYQVIMRQELRKEDPVAAEKAAAASPAGGATIASAQGLSLLRKNYSYAFASSPTPVPLDEGSTEKVIKVKFTWRSTEEGFRQLDIAFTNDYFIRRIVGITQSYEKIQFDFEQVKKNIGIPDSRFEFTGGNSANVYENFLFGTE